MCQVRIDQGGRQAKDRDHRYGVGNLFIISANGRTGGHDGAHTADRGTYGDQRPQPFWQIDPPVDARGKEQRANDTEYHNWHAIDAQSEYVKDRQADPQENDPQP